MKNIDRKKRNPSTAILSRDSDTSLEPWGRFQEIYCMIPVGI